MGEGGYGGCEKVWRLTRFLIHLLHHTGFPMMLLWRDEREGEEEEQRLSDLQA